MKGAIVYYSRTKNNKVLADRLRDQLNFDLFEVKEKKKRNVISVVFDVLVNRNIDLIPIGHELQTYDHLILIAPIWGKRMAAPFRSFLKQHKSSIHQYSFITLCNGVIGQKTKLINELTSIIGHGPHRIQQLWINELLPAFEQNTIKHTFRFRIKPEDIEVYQHEIDAFVQSI